MNGVLAMHGVPTCATTVWILLMVAACQPRREASAGGAAGDSTSALANARANAQMNVVAHPDADTGAAGANTPAGAKRPAVLFIGTSLTAGYGLDDPATQAYPAQLGRLADSAGFPIRVINAGVSGETSAGALQRVSWLLREPSDIIVLETGANDGLRGLSVAAARSNIEQIVTQLQAARPGVPIVLVQMEAPPNLGNMYVTQFHAMYGTIAKEKGLTLTPFLLRGVAGIARLNQPDGVHPTVTGAGIAAHTVWSTLEPIVRRYYP
jgi:acyl-CoA thioesterase-1